MSPCAHTTLSFTPSRHAKQAGYIHPDPGRLFDATSISGKKEAFRPHAPESTFPAPLVLPGDDLSFEPDYAPQTASECVNGEYRNPIRPDKRTIYVVSEPTISDELKGRADSWTRPNLKRGAQHLPSKPATKDVLAYLAAFYHPLPVKLLKWRKLSFVPWEEEVTRRRKKASPSRVGLQISPNHVIGIQYRTSRDGLYSEQLSLNDLLDAAIEMLPKDAYSLLMLSDHDLYEDDEDDFCCGRAYGGSRVAVVSWARYNPVLDAAQRVETEHAWPASHCREYMGIVCADAEPPRKKMQSATGKSKSAKTIRSDQEPLAMHDAVKAYSSLGAPTTAEELSNLWLGRFCKTASHELGHCFGMDHCVYYACVMQGTSGLSEDARQPPYLCPVDLAKVRHATGAREAEHCGALLRFCLLFPQDRMFKAFGEWLRVRLYELQGPVQPMPRE